MSVSAKTILVPDSGPLITLAYAGALDLLLKPGWEIGIVDMVLHEITRTQTLTSQAISAWVKSHVAKPMTTKVYERHLQDLANNVTPVRKSHLGEEAAQEAMLASSLLRPPPTCVFLFEEYRLAKAQFVLPSNCRKISTKAFLIFLEEKGWIASATAVEREAIKNGRNFSQVRFPP